MKIIKTSVIGRSTLILRGEVELLDDAGEETLRDVLRQLKAARLARVRVGTGNAHCLPPMRDPTVAERERIEEDITLVRRRLAALASRPWYFTGNGAACSACHEAGYILDGHFAYLDPDRDGELVDGAWRETVQADPWEAARQGWERCETPEAATIAAMSRRPS